MLVLLTGCPKGQTSLVTVYPKDGLDPATKTFIENELMQLLAATEHPNFDITVTLQQPEVGTAVAMTSPKGDIIIRPAAVTNAMKSQAALWSLRMLIAHELGHIMASHWFTHVSRQPQKEL
jgi:predicted Zn-dependent protease